MKITQYFTSPSKEAKRKLAENNEIVTETGNKNVNIENSQGEMATNKKLKKKRRQVTNDPIVKDVTALFSNKLSLISPNSGASEKNPISNSPTISSQTDYETSLVTTNNIEIEINNEKTESPKGQSNVNAFQFLMNSRNNVIGQNLGGRIIPMQPSTSTTNEEKNKLASRKDLFQNWSDQKGALKRKRDEDDIEYCINYKMERRARRLKKMLHNNGHIETEELKVVKRRRKKVRKISSGSESSEGQLCNDSVPVGLSTSNLKEINEEDVQNISTNIITEKVQNNLHNFVGLNKNKDVKVFDDKPSDTNLKHKKVIKVKMFSPRSSKKVILKGGESDNKDKLVTEQNSDSCLSNLQKHESVSPNSKIETSESSSLILRNNKSDDNSSNSYISSPRRSLRAHKKKLNYSEIGLEISEIKNKNNKVFNTSEKHNKSAETLIPGNLSTKNAETNKTKRKQLKQKKQNKSEIDILELTDSDEDDFKTKPIKVAPLFLKAKPKLDKETIEARKQFLMSGVPESLKKTVEKQKRMEEIIYNAFPLKSHIQQKCDNPYWNLSQPELSFLDVSEFNYPKTNCKNLIRKENLYQPNFIVSEKMCNIKYHLKNIKTENPHYPVYKVFKYIYQNSGHLLKKSTSKTLLRKKSKKEGRRISDELISSNDESTTYKFELWTEKYKPKASEEILGNQKVIGSLKSWLETWMNYSKKIIKKRDNASSESEFDFTDGDSRDSIRMLGNTMIITGPCGSGKTSAVYTIANELGFNVLEVNSSSRRTGKKIIQELQEATQSHQVRKNENAEKKEKRNLKKMCILLVEDIDLVFDQDEGFLSSLYQLITTSKRPIILTTTDTTALHVQKLLNQHECIMFRPIYKEMLGVWLQIVCLVEGMLVDKNDIGNLLNYYRGDVRKALLAAQYWCLSGGQLNRDRTSFLTISASPESPALEVIDDELKISVEQNNEEDTFIHTQSLVCFEICQQNRIPYGFDLGKMWWNIPHMLNMPECSDRLYRDGYVTNVNNIEDETVCNSITNLHIDSLLSVYDSLILTDMLDKTPKWGCEEPVVNSWFNPVRDSLELTERDEDISESINLTCDIIHVVVNGCVQEYQDMYSISPKLDLTAPNSLERRWRSKQHMLENFLKQAVATTNVLQRSAVAMDYLPTLRQFARSEEKRSTVNTKRGNRFRHYFRSLNMEFNVNKSKLCCNILNFSNIY